MCYSLFLSVSLSLSLALQIILKSETKLTVIEKKAIPFLLVLTFSL